MLIIIVIDKCNYCYREQGYVPANYVQILSGNGETAANTTQQLKQYE